VDLLLLGCRDCGFESHLGNGYLSVASVLCFQEEVSAKDRSIFQRTPKIVCVADGDCVCC